MDKNKELIDYFVEMAELNGWKVTKVSDARYEFCSTVPLTCCEPYKFVVEDNRPLTAAAFVDVIDGEYEDFDVSAFAYEMLNEEGYYKKNPFWNMGDVYSDMKKINDSIAHLLSICKEELDKAAADYEFYAQPHTTEEKAHHAITRYLDREDFSDGDVCEMMYDLVKRLTHFAVERNNSRTNHLAREMFGDTFPEDVLCWFDEQE